MRTPTCAVCRHLVIKYGGEVTHMIREFDALHDPEPDIEPVDLLDTHDPEAEA